MRATNLLFSILILAVAVGAPAQTTDLATARMAPVANQAADHHEVTTTRDAQGVWFIEGGSLYDVFEAQGYAEATDRLFQMDLTRRFARGKLSELVGAEFLGVDFLSADIATRNVMYSDDEFTEMFNALSEDTQTAIQAYVDGVNRRITIVQANWNIMPYEYWIGSFYSWFVQGLGYNMLPEAWTANDVLGVITGMSRQNDPEGRGSRGQIDNAMLFGTWSVVYPTEVMAMFFDLRWLNDPSAQTMIPATGKEASLAQPQLAAIKADSFPNMREAAEQIRWQFDIRERALEAIGTSLKMGSYAWTVSGDKTESGNPIIYSGPQLDFSAPPIVLEGSIRGGGFDVSGMSIAGIPGIIIGRTPHHAWSMQNGAAHTLDWFAEAPQSVFFHRTETFNVAGGEPVTYDYYRSHHGPIVSPFPYDPNNPPGPEDPPIISYAYAHWGREAKSLEGLLNMARAESIAEFGDGIHDLAVSFHFCYADRDGNIAYWMSGFDPIRLPTSNPFFPQPGDGAHEWTGEFRPLAHDVNTAQGYYGGWNNKPSVDYNSGTNLSYFGPAHRAAEVEAYLSTHDNHTFEDLRDLAIDIATTTTDDILYSEGGNTWRFVGDAFEAAVAADPSPDRDAAIAMLDAWDGHFVAGGPPAWRFGPLRADAWVLQDAWVQEVLRLTFEDEFAGSLLDWNDQSKFMLFQVLVRALAGGDAALPTNYDWFQDKLASGKPTTAEGIIVQALDNVIADMGLGPYNEPRGTIDFGHSLLGNLDPAYNTIHSIPFSSRSIYAHVVEMGENGPVRIESMFPLGESGQLWFDGTFNPVFDPNFFSMAPNYNPFMPRDFPIFD